MTEENSLKSQRNRFLAFSFASADLFIEVSEDSTIVYALGAAKGLIGVNEKSLIGRDWLELFDPIDRPVLRTMLARAKPVLRCGPILVALNKTISDGKKAVVTGIKMPDSAKFFITIGLSNIMMAKIGQGVRERNEKDLLDKESFTAAAEDIFNMSRDMGQNVDITLFDLAANNQDMSRIGADGWKSLMDSISSLLMSKSVDGQTAAEVAKGRFSLVHDKTIAPETLKEQIEALTKEQDPTGEGLQISAKTVSSDIENLSERDLSRALVYTINEFERKGTSLSIETLNSGFKTYVSSNALKVKEFQNMIERSSFSLHFQPIVNLKTLEATHYEMLSRFEQGDTMEWVMFGEDIGMAAEFDIAVCQRAIDYVNFKAGGTNTRFSVNISGQSIENEAFNEKLKKMLSKHKNLNNRIMFEITESSHIHDLSKVNASISDLRKDGYQIALDDFGAGSASFQYLQQLEIDYLKIDGKYIRKIMTSQRDLAMVKNLAQMCADLGIKVVAEFVEDEEQLEALRSMGIQYGQGYLFGKPRPKTDYIPPSAIDKV
jgi:EAL domain-containing protein (putative c-di-GMP-specific phosphodiesterase class I)